MRPRTVTLAPDMGIFFVGCLLQYIVVYWGVPGLVGLGLEPMLAWMLLSVPLIFVPIMVGGVVLLRSEPRPQNWGKRLWLTQLSAADWRWGGIGLIGLAVGSGLMFLLCVALGQEPNPPFARDVQPLTADRLWMIGVWAVYWPINILGEELLWRGIVLRRMEHSLGVHAWLLNACLWGVFHLAFGLGNLLVLVPTLALVPLIAQRRRNTWLAILLHAGLSAPGFVALALGLAR